MLLVEGNADARHIVTTMLVQQGAEVTAVGSAAEALGRLGRSAFDVLLADLAMPEMDGDELLARARTAGHGLPAVALTASIRPSGRERARAAGFDAHVGKPIDPAEVASIVARLTGRGASGD